MTKGEACNWLRNLRADMGKIEHQELWHYEQVLEEIADIIERLPSIERKKGKWIKMSDADGIYYCCSECGEELYRMWDFDREYNLFPRKRSIDKTDFCSHCGADMRGKKR